MSSDATDCLIGFGANLGQPESALQQVIDHLQNTSTINSVVTSRPYQTRSVGDPDQPDYLNAAIRITTTLAAPELLQLLLEIEKNLGRQREHGSVWQPRKADLDILLFGSEIIRQNQLVVPHPRMTFRRFVLEPASEIANELIHPVCQVSIGDLLKKINQKKKFILLAVDAAFQEKNFFERVLEIQSINFSENRFHFAGSQTPDGIEIGCVKSAQQYRQQAATATLVAVFQEHVQRADWIRETQHFPGPSIVLVDDKPITFAKELDAACQAMMPLER